MSVEIREYPASLRASEVDCHHTTAGLQNSLDLACALLPSLPRQMVKHQRAEHDVESPIRKRQVLGNRNLKRDTRAGLFGFAIRARNHGGRSVDARQYACRPSVPGSGNP